MSGPRSATPPAEERFGVPPATPRGGRAAVLFWSAVVVVYAALGAWKPYVFLLGFWQTTPYLLLATYLSGRLSRRLRARDAR